MFQLLNISGEGLALPGIETGRFSETTDTAKFDLTLTIVETSQGLSGGISYNTDLFDGHLKRMAGHFNVLLESIIADPQQQITNLAILTEQERDQLLIEWNSTVTDYPREASIPELFESQVEGRPDAIAVIYEEQAISYRELNGRANQLAHYLIGQGSARRRWSASVWSAAWRWSSACWAS